MNITTKKFESKIPNFSRPMTVAVQRSTRDPKEPFRPATASLRPLRMALMAFNLRLVRSKAPRFSPATGLLTKWGKGMEEGDWFKC